jgi:hypothetical protein
MATHFLPLLVLVGIFSTFVILSVGMASFFKGQRPSTNQLMRWRVILQAITLFLFFLMLWLK